MPRRQIFVDTLIEETKAEIEKRSGAKYDAVVHKRWEGIPVNGRVHSILTKLLTTYKNYRVGVSSDLTKEWVKVGEDSIRVFSEVWIYVPSERYARGRVGYGEFFSGKSGVTYMLYNHTIHNNKYNSSGEHYHMMLSSKEDTLLKNAYKHLKPHDLYSIAHLEKWGFLTSMRDTANKKESEATELFKDKIKDSVVAELRHALNIGHTFQSEDFKQNLTDYFTKRDEFRAYNNKLKNAKYVCIRTDHNGEQVVDILNCIVSRGTSFKTADSVTVKMSDIPVDIAGKIAVLSMVEDGHYVENVGSKVSADGYWIECD